jgi:hypothetical protein
MSADRVREIQKISQEPVSLETPIGEEEDSQLGDFLPDEGAADPFETTSAAMLHDGKNYQEISKHTGASTATICRVNKCLLYGSGGYRTVLGDTKKGETR